MKGGYQIIDIRKLNLTLSNSTQSITDVEILEQLRSLRAYIEKGHDFTKPLDNALKCIQIRYRDQKNGEKLEACQWANIETSNNSLTYEIKTKNLMIEIVFEEKTDEYDNKYYDIKTAKYLYNHNEIIEGKLTVSGDVSIGGDIEVDESSEVKIFENIVDKDGHKRFIDIDFSANPIEHITYTYTKASLSGSHLLIVLAGQVETGTGTIAPQPMANVTLPQWITSKIFPTYGAYVGGFTGQIVTAETYATYNLNFAMDKTSNGVRVDLGENIGLGENIKYFRVSIDLLIDNESQD